jgi:penicillin-binding protein 1A
LKDYRVAGDLLPGVVLSVEERSVRVYTQDGYLVEVGWDGLSWARKYIDERTQGPAPKTAAAVARPGDIIYLEYVETEDRSEPKQTSENTAPPPDQQGQWWLAQRPKVAGALVAMRPSDGAILALTGGFDFQESKFNRVTQAERQPGSNLKPFIYSAALEKGFTAATPVSGAPVVIEDKGLEEIWRPDNYSERFFGPTPLRKALALSINLVSVRLLRAIEPAYAAEYLERFGFDRNKLPRNLSLALGTASATPLQMVNAFAVFANGGYRVEPYFITRVEDTEGNLLEQANPLVICAQCEERASVPAPPEPVDAPVDEAEQAVGPRYAPRVISKENAFIMSSIMQDVITRGTGRRALELGRADLAGKTGTTNEFRDAWFSGFSRDLVATTWLGFDQPASLGPGEAGARAALPIWVNFMAKALKGLPETPLVVPDGVVAVSVDSETGEPIEPESAAAIVEYFLAGTEPISSGGLAAEGEAEEDSKPTVPSVVEIPKGLF